MPKLVFPDGSTVFVKNGTTEFPFVSATGGLYHQGTILPNSSLLSPLANVTWPSTVATTLVDTTTTQELINKTINNITVTDPTSDAAGTLTIADGGTLATAGAFQHKFTSTADSAVTLPGATDGVLMWTTELDGKITAKTTQINVLGVVTWPTTTAQTLVNTTDAQTLENKTLGAGTVESIETATSDSVLVNYGVSVVSSIAAGGAFTVGIAAPSSGVRKTIIVAAANSSDTVVISNGTTAVQFGFATTQTYNIITFSNPGIAELIGVSTAKYHILSLGSTAYAGTTTLPTLSS